MKKTLDDLIHLTGYREEDAATLGRHQERIEGWAADIVTMFYDTLLGYETTSGLFRDGERPSREETLREWLIQVAGGHHGNDFWRHQWVVGLIHIKRHVSNTFVLSMMGRVQQLFLSKCLKDLEIGEAERLFGAFKRTTDVVAGLIAEGYHQGYREAVADITGMKSTLLDRMGDVAVDRLLARAQTTP